MPAVSKIRRDAIEHLREVHEAPEQTRLSMEQDRIEEFFTDVTELLDFREVDQIMNEYRAAQPDHIRALALSYKDHDKEYGTRILNPWLFDQMLQASDYLTPQKRSLLFDPQGMINTGFPTQGPLPEYGAWEGRSMSENEEQRHQGVLSGERDYNKLMAANAKIRTQGYAFESENVASRGFEAVMGLMDGIVGKEISREEIDESKYVVPFFSIGQKMGEDGLFKKIRPVANEKRRNLLVNPIAEHLTLPGIPAVIDGVVSCANPLYADTFVQSRHEVTKGIEEGRKRKKDGKLSWLDIQAIPRASPGYVAGGFIPCIGKIDLFRAYMQLGVKCPEENQFQIHNPESGKMHFGRFNTLTFGNTHSVFGFCAAVSEPLNHIINKILKIPAFVYVDDIVFFGAPETIVYYSQVIRRLCAILGIAVAPEKTEACRHGEKVEVLGIDFCTSATECRVSLPEKKKESTSAQLLELASIVERWEESKHELGAARIMELVQKACGSCIHTMFARKHKRNIPITKFMYTLTGSLKVFSDKMAAASTRRNLIFLLRKAVAIIKEARPLVLTLRDAQKGRAHTFTDASASKGEVASGGIVYDELQRSTGFQLHMSQSELPEVLKNQTIMVCEVVAVAMAQRVFEAELSRNHNIIHVDNAAAVYGIVKGMVSSLTTTAAIFVANDHYDRVLDTSYPFFAYVSTNSNPADACTRMEYLRLLIQAHGTAFKHNREELICILHQIAAEMQTAMNDFLLLQH